MKKLFYMLALIAMLFTANVAQANVTFTPGSPTLFNNITYPMDTKLALEFMSPYWGGCTTSDVSDDTMATFNASGWNTTDPNCGATKPVWTDVVSSNENALSIYNEYLGLNYNNVTYANASLVPTLSSSLSTLSTTVASHTSSLSTISGNISTLQSQVTTMQSGLPVMKDGATTLTGSAVITNSATVASGVATFYLTSDATATGATLCSTGTIDFKKAEIGDASNSYNYSYALSGKTLTVTANQVTVILGALGVTTAANGKVVNLMVICH